MVRMRAGEQARVVLRQDSGDALDIAGNGYWNWLTIAKRPIEVAVDDTRLFTVSSGAFTRVDYATPRIDDSHRFGDSVYIAGATGEYPICASLAVPGVRFELDVFVDGNREVALAGGTGVAGGCGIVHLDAGARAEVRVIQLGGRSSVVVDPDPRWNWLTVGPAR